MTPDDITTSARLAGLVKRYHTWPVLTTQSVGEHSWQVFRIYYELFGEVPTETAHHIMFHDCGELVTGDPPYPIKANNPPLKAVCDVLESIAMEQMGLAIYELEGEEILRVKICHMIEMAEFGLHEVTLGNEYGRPIYDRCRDAALAIASGLDENVRARVALHFARGHHRLA